MVPLAQAAVEYGVLASRGGVSEVGSAFVDGLTSGSLETYAWVAAAVGVVLLATRRTGRLGFALLLVCAGVLAARWLDLP